MSSKRKKYKPKDDKQLQQKIYRDKQDLILNLLRDNSLTFAEIAEIAEISELEIEKIAQKYIHKKI
ncbi:MAG: hypothetical protein NZ551_12095 [Microscillaceae bacterium]|nr:hypothetical protein [Microscillaceae bacterium]MDW8461936.1 hypothetical protein [Cytophagales bacterium]